MIYHYIKTAWRNLWRNKIYSGINIAGLAIALAAFWMIALYVFDEFSYDRYNTNAQRIVRVVQHTSVNGNNLRQASVSTPLAPALKAAFPEIEEAVRIDMDGGKAGSYHKNACSFYLSFRSTVTGTLSLSGPAPVRSISPLW